MYSLGEANKIEVYSNLGRVIKDKIRDIMGQGSHQRRWHLCQSQYKESGVTLRVSTEYPRRGRQKKKKPYTGLERYEGWEDQQQMRPETSGGGGEQVRLETSGGRSRSRADFGAQS